MYYLPDKYNLYEVRHEQHPFHLVDPSPWPLFASITAFNLTVSLVGWMHTLSDSTITLHFSIIGLLFCSYRWFQDIITESAFQGKHTWKVVQGLQYGMLLFIVSEAMFFFSFFFAFFYFALTPSIWTGGIWPPKGIVAINPWQIPFWNTLILLSSGVLATWAHASIIAGDREDAFVAMLLTILSGFVFSLFQLTEYMNTSFCINDTAYGSIFYLVTGFHGFHVFIGTIFIFVCWLRIANPRCVSYTQQHHFGFIAALWYWHFVDVVWIFVFFVMYVWGSFGAWPGCSEYFLRSDYHKILLRYLIESNINIHHFRILFTLFFYSMVFAGSYMLGVALFGNMYYEEDEEDESDEPVEPVAPVEHPEIPKGYMEEHDIRSDNFWDDSEDDFAWEPDKIREAPALMGYFWDVFSEKKNND